MAKSNGMAAHISKIKINCFAKMGSALNAVNTDGS